MRNSTLAVACVLAAVAFPIGASAQQPPAQPAPAQPPTSTQPTSTQPAMKAKAEGAVITITGCLKRSDATPDANAAGDKALPSATAGAKYILTNVIEQKDVKSPGTPATTGTTGTTASQSDARSQVTYALEPGATVALDAHVNHKVEITGTKSKTEKAARAGESMASHPQPQPNPQAIGTSGVKAMSTVKVQSLRMVAESCM